MDDVPPQGDLAGYADRFAEQTYADNEPVVIGLIAEAACRGFVYGKSQVEYNKVDWRLEIPEALFARLQRIASAYVLHLLPAIDVYTDTLLTPEQCATLGEELAFVRSVVKDDLLNRYLIRFSDIIAEGHRSSTRRLVLCGP